MKLIKKHQKGNKINKPVNFEKLDHYTTVGLYGDDYHERAQKFLGVEDPKSYLFALDSWNWHNKIVPEINRYYENNPKAKKARIDERDRIENEIVYKNSKDIHLELQKRLKEIGLYDGQLDGIWGPKSQKAMDDYHRLTRKLWEDTTAGWRWGPTKDNDYNYKPLIWGKNDKYNYKTILNNSYNRKK